MAFNKEEIRSNLKKWLPEPVLNFVRYIVLRKHRKKSPYSESMRMFKSLKNRIYLNKLRSIVIINNMTSKDLHSLFHKCSDDFWFWLFTEGNVQNSTIKKILPKLPEQRIQLQFTGVSGIEALSEAFLFYKLIMKFAGVQDLILNPESKILDFGCGWGRVIRFFLKEVPSSNLFGMDCDKDVIEISQSSGLGCNFLVNDIYPPTTFQDNQFDIIY